MKHEHPASQTYLTSIQHNDKEPSCEVMILFSSKPKTQSGIEFLDQDLSPPLYMSKASAAFLAYLSHLL